MKYVLIVALMICSPGLYAKKLESDYRDVFCRQVNGKTEYRLEDNARVDCLSDRYAIEIEYAKKWAEGIGQSLYYAQMTHKTPAIGLIIADGKEEVYLKRLTHVADKHGIKIFIIKKDVE